MGVYTEEQCNAPCLAQPMQLSGILLVIPLPGMDGARQSARIRSFMNSGCGYTEVLIENGKCDYFELAGA